MIRMKNRFVALVLVAAFLHGNLGVALAFPEDSPTDNEQLKQVADLEKTISQRELELKNLKRQAINLRRMVEANQKGTTKFYTSSVEMVDDMPPSAFPKAGPEFTMERQAAKKWFETHFPGRGLQLYANIYDVLVEGEGPYTVTVYCRSGNIHYLPKNGKNMQFDRTILLEGQQCAVMLSGIPNENFLSFSALDKEGSWIARYNNCTAEEVEHLRTLKGQDVTLKGKILHTLYQEKDVADETMGVVVSVSPMTINDFMPKTTKAEGAKLEAEWNARPKH